jgi:hypothetical protein
MLDRQKLETILTRRFPGAGTSQVAAAANAIMGLDDEWEEVLAYERGHHAGFEHLAGSAHAHDPAADLRLFRRRDG